MSTNDSVSRSRIATIVTTAALTLAAGVTAAALGGYLVPGPRTQAEMKTEVAVSEPTLASKPPTVVLVPVSQAPSEESASALADGTSGEPLFAVADHEHDEDEREHHSSHHESDDDD